MSAINLSALSNEDVTYIVGVGCGLIALIAFVWLIARPAWTSYSTIPQRFAAAFLSLYVLAAFVGLGVGGGLLIVWFWDRIEGSV
jgi:hypothetical protein